ncbi:MAG TPA: metal-dependent hydrolase [Acidimicrobiia bacterium]|nr:metal-dependent hydrolase [Acidimicrobiia bacterium]
MLFWRLGAVTFLFRWIFRDPIVDMRFLAVGVVLPDLIDLVAATLVGADDARLWGHSLLVPSTLAITILLATRRGRRRRAWMALVVAWMLHLVVDQMWFHEHILFWPVFGWDIVVPSSDDFWAAAWGRALSDPWRWVLEFVGVAYLAWLYVTSGLRDAKARERLMSTGRLV